MSALMPNGICNRNQGLVVPGEGYDFHRDAWGCGER